MDILDYFPYENARPSQLQVLRWVQDNWNKYDVMVLQCPVASGKSGLAVTIGNWAYAEHGLRCGITTPDNVLVGQYRNDFKLLTLPLVRQFASREFYEKARDEFRQAPIKVMNNWTLLASRAYSPVQIMDEAHQLIPMLQDFEGLSIWKHLDYYPDGLNTTADVLMWAASLGPKDKLGKKIVKLLSTNPLDYTVVHEVEVYRGSPQEKLRIYPLTPKNNKPILWPPHKVRKLILMSATIAEPDVIDLGLKHYRVGYIEVPSDIPRANRPFVYLGVGGMGQKDVKTSMPRAVAAVNMLHKRHNGRGMIHSTYQLAGRIFSSLAEGMMIVHNSFDKKDKLASWLAQRDDTRSFLGCGLTTGLNLKGDVCTWQVILKCQFPDLGDPAVLAKANQNPEWYAWTAIKQIVQAYGRVCRSPEDYGITYMVDSDFIVLYTRHRQLFPKWFTEAITI